MLAFALDITQNKPANPKESENDGIKQYMDYQRKLNHVNLVKNSLEYAKNQLQKTLYKTNSLGKSIKPSPSRNHLKPILFEIILQFGSLYPE